jgi:membrane protease YdiL (CAAX protease family)
MYNQSLGNKILHFPLTRIVIGFIVVLTLVNLGKAASDILLKEIIAKEDWSKLIRSIVVAILAIAAYTTLYKYYERRKINEFSSRHLFQHLLTGIALGAVLQSLTISVIYLAGDYSVLSVNPILFIIPPFAMAFSSAIIEEILLRGIVFRITEEKLGSYAALIISALLFGLMHLANPNSSLLAGLGLAVQAGLLLAAAYIYTRNLWFPIALHFAWNFTQSAIFGANVSGNTVSKTLITSSIQGPQWLTGGEFGPEGSIQATLFCLIPTTILLLLSYKQGKIIKPYWKLKNEEFAVA